MSTKFYVSLEGDIVEKFKGFYESPLRNGWIKNELMEVYCRKAHHLVDKQVHQFIDIGGITVRKEYRGYGLCRNFFDAILKQYPHENTYVENVVNPILAEMLSRKGFSYVTDQLTACGPMCYSYFLLRKQH